MLARARPALQRIDLTDVVVPMVCVVILVRSPALLAFFFLAMPWILVERRAPYRKQGVFRPQWLTDVYHAFVTRGLAQLIGAGIIAALASEALLHALSPYLGRFHSQPFALQAVEALLISDLADYGQHRAMHAVPLLWRFHRVHHSIENLDWLGGFRAHPVDAALATICAGAPLYVLGMPPIFMLLFTAFDTINTPFSHGNLNLSLGRFWWIVRNPEYHRWHHSKDRIGMNRNFAQCFPIWDIIFGTAYLPKDRAVSSFGLVGEVLPADYALQLLSPFTPATTSPAQSRQGA